MDWLNTLIEISPFVALTVFLLGLLVALAPCPLAANIAAVGFLARETKGAAAGRGGLFYALGRAVSYALLAALVVLGASTVRVDGWFRSLGDWLIGPLLLIAGLVVMGIIHINLPTGGSRLAAFKERLARRGGIGAFLLGVLLAFALCPYSAAIFFGALMPIVIKSPFGLLLPLIFGFGTALPVIVFAWLIAYSADRVGRGLLMAQRIERPMRYFTGAVMVLAGLYYIYASLRLFI